MSWLFSRALVAEFSGGTCSAGALSALSSGSPTPQAFLPSDRMTAFSRPSRFGMTFSPLTDALGAELLTWFLAASRARTSALQAKAQGLTACDPACGRTWRGWLAKYDRVSSSWRTAQQSFLEDSGECLETFPRWGTTRDGLLWEQPTLEPLTSETGSGLWPTPVADDTGLRKKPYAQGGTPLSLAATTWPTPTVCGNYNRKGASKTSGDGLATAVRMWPTPTSSNGLDGGSHSRAACAKAGQVIPSGGSLNPTWVEWLMGWPPGWTDLKPLVTGKSRCALQPHGAFSLAEAEPA